MKNGNACPKCAGSKIIRINGFSGMYGSGNNIPVGFGSIGVQRYLCCTCGYSEEWIDEEDIPKLEKKFRTKK